MKKRLLSLLLALIMVFGLSTTAFAVDNTAEDAANRLYELGLFRGTGTDGNGNPIFDLEKPLDRHSAVTMLVRLLGKEEEALSGEWETPFTDVASWAKPYVGYAYANGLTNGTSATTFGGTAPVTTAQYLTFVLRALGYSSETDFLWSSPWALSNAIGLTDGRYSAANNNAFVRGDMAIISADALDVTVNGSKETLAEKIGVFVPTEEDYLKRVLSDKQLAKLMDADLDTLRAEISTIGDAVAFLEQFTPNGYSGFSEEIRLDIEFLFDLHTRPEATTSQTYAAFAAWCITDDYEGIKYIVCVSDVSGCRISPALALPVAGGYYIASPGEGTEAMNGNFHAIKPVVVDSLDDLSKKIAFESRSLVLQQVFVADADQPDLKFAVDENAKRAVVSVGNATLAYQISQEEIAAAAEAKRQERIRFAWGRLQNNWESYGMPASMAPTMSREEVEKLVGKDIDTVAAACKTLGDCLYYYALSGFEGCGGDLQTYDGNIGGGNLFWHYNYAPQETFLRNTGNCGASSGLTSYLLQGDYDTVGMLGMTFVEGAGGGHFINYLYDGTSYYVFDIVNLLSWFDQSGFCFSTGNTLISAANIWIEQGESPVRLMWAYQSFDGDVPVGWDWGSSHISYLPAEYKDKGEILIETPSEGYVYQWVTISANIREQINGNRAPMRELPGEDVTIDTTGSYMTRVLTDEQLAALKYATAETLQAWISTVVDAVAYLDQFEQHSYNSINSGFKVDVEFLLDLHRREATAPDTYTALTGWFLVDDYPEVKYLAATVLKEADITVHHGLLLPAENGYQVINPSQHSQQENAVFGFDEMVVENLTETGIKLSPYHAGMRDDSNLIMYHLLAVDAGEKTLSVSADGNYFLVPSDAEELYRVSKKTLSEKAFANVLENWNSYGFPKNFNPTLSKAEVEELIGKDIDTVSAALKTVGDVIYYFALSGYEIIGGDMDVQDGEYYWTFNRAPNTVFSTGWGNCGGTSGIFSYFLQGDYDEVGILTMTSSVEMGGGHVINYVQNGRTCYVFDPQAICLVNFTNLGAPLCTGSTVISAGRQWQARTNNDYRLIFAYPSSDGDMPHMGAGKTVYLPEQYRDRITIVYEDTKQGYHYEWRTISEKALEKIQQKRN